MDDEISPIPRSGSPRLGKPKSYKQICISMYNEDLKQVDEMVHKLKGCGVQVARLHGCGK